MWDGTQSNTHSEPYQGFNKRPWSSFQPSTVLSIQLGWFLPDSLPNETRQFSREIYLSFAPGRARLCSTHHDSMTNAPFHVIFSDLLKYLNILKWSMRIRSFYGMIFSCFAQCNFSFSHRLANLNKRRNRQWPRVAPCRGRIAIQNMSYLSLRVDTSCSENLIGRESHEERDKKVGWNQLCY